MSFTNTLIPFILLSCFITCIHTFLHSFSLTLLSVFILHSCQESLTQYLPPIISNVFYIDQWAHCCGVPKHLKMCILAPRHYVMASHLTSTQFYCTQTEVIRVVEHLERRKIQYCPSNTIWGYRSESTLFQVMAWCLTASIHYLNQCWLITDGALQHLFRSEFEKLHFYFRISQGPVIELTQYLLHC